jgi:hypothetical protein
MAQAKVESQIVSKPKKTKQGQGKHSLPSHGRKLKKGQG